MDAKKDCDFSGWATKNDVRCSDGRTIRRDAFKDNDGQRVPLVWNHDHQNAENVLGHAILENRDEGIYAYVFLNGTENGRLAKALVSNRDICSLSIYANQLQQNGSDVIHGVIREVSLVLAGANPQASIENIMIHGDNAEEGAIIYNDAHELEFEHTAIENPKEGVKVDNPVVTSAAPVVPAAPVTPTPTDPIAHADPDPNLIEGETVQSIYDKMDEKEKAVVDILVGEAIQEEAAKHNPNKEGNNMGATTVVQHNAFDQTADPTNTANKDDPNNQDHELSHSEFVAYVEKAKQIGSFKTAAKDAGISVLTHADPTYGIANIGNLLPDSKGLTSNPSLVTPDQAWVAAIMGGVKHTPFSRVKSIYANLSEADLKAKGYLKGNLKTDDVVAVLKRSTTPQTIYKHQKLDRDDIIDIIDFDVVAWIKSEMRLSLNDEIARDILIGDGRSSSSDDKVNPINVRPIYGDEDAFVYKDILSPVYGATADSKINALMEELIRSRKNYKGSGNPVLFTTEDELSSMLLLKDTTGRRIYPTVTELCTAMRVSGIVTVPVMEGVTRIDGATTYKLLAILVDLRDYNVGADKGGEVNLFDDFDIDYNQQKYLIETRISGALVTPCSAITFEEKVAVAG